ncbi:MAG: ABC transporter ATP-binding protein, partial [Bacteroidota bacterium]
RFWLYMIGEKSSVDVQLNVLQHMAELDLHWHETENSGNKLKKIARGGSSLNVLVRMYVDMVIDSIVGLLGVLVVFSVLNLWLNVLLVAFFISHYFLSLYLTRRAMDQAKDVNRIDEAFSGLKFELLNGITTVKSMSLIGSLLIFVKDITQRLIASLRLRIILFRTRMAVLGMNQQVFRLLIVAFAVWQVMEGNFEVGVIAQVFLYTSKIEVAASRFSNLYHRLVMAQIDMQGVGEIMAEEPVIEDQGHLSLHPDWNHLRVEDVHFSYGEKKVLNGVSFDMKRGEKIGLVGVSGAGKSTLLKLLQKLYIGYQGRILIDDVELGLLKRKSLSQKSGVVLQETELFDLSIRDNITFGQEDIPMQHLDKALQMSAVDQMVAQQTEGLNTLVGEKGIRLSGGERQRIGIARAVYRQPDILFLDEATAHLDAASESVIQVAISQMLEGTTAFVIAHRLSTLRDMDRILVLADGQIIESGNFSELLKKEGVFAEMWAKQHQKDH